MVTAEAVWKALADIPDPEIPVISLVDLGVVKDVAVDGTRVRIAFTPISFRTANRRAHTRSGTAAPTAPPS